MALGFLSAKSEVDVIRTRSAAERELSTARRILENPSKLQCLTSAFDAMLGGSHTTEVDGHTLRTTIGKTHAAPLQVASATAGTAGGFGITLSMQVTYSFSVHGHQFTVPGAFYMDSLQFVLGRAGVGLTTMAFGQPFPPEREAALFSLLVARALKAGRQAPALTE